MTHEYFHHPCRFPKNVAGPFYSTGVEEKPANGAAGPACWSANCLVCEAPEEAAPELLAPLCNGNLDTYFVRQPVTSEEIAQAIQAIRVCCTAALRYGGQDRQIIASLGNSPEFCDYIVAASGNLVCTVGPDGYLLPFAEKLLPREWALFHPQLTNRTKRWWQFWR